MIRTDILSDKVYDQQRFERITQRHINAIAWKPQNYIPLGIIVNNPDNITGISYEQYLDAEVFFEVQAKILRDTLIVGSDHLPVMPLNHLGAVLIPSMFGAEIRVPTEMAGSLQDQGPVALPAIDSIETVDNLFLPEMETGLMPDIADIIRSWHKWSPPWVDVITTFPVAPFSLAASLRGSEIFQDIVDDPHRCHRLFALCAQAQIKVELYLRGLIGQPRCLPISNFGVRSLGQRLGDDWIINLSPKMITEFALAHIETIAKQFGPATVHFCTLADRRADHVFEPLSLSPGINMVSTQFGFEYYANHVDVLRGRLAVECFYGDAYKYVCEKFGSFRDWAFDFVPRYKNESGLIMYFEVDSLELGHQLWHTWQQAHQRTSDL